jgi:hypothetical protein
VDSQTRTAALYERVAAHNGRPFDERPTKHRLLGRSNAVARHAPYAGICRWVGRLCHILVLVEYDLLDAGLDEQLGALVAREHRHVQFLSKTTDRQARALRVLGAGSSPKL